MTHELRCTAEHPRFRGRVCNAKLADVIHESVAVVRVVTLLAIGPGCALVACERCGTRYVLCPRPVAQDRAAG